MIDASFLIFSGHNYRAVISLCRYFTKCGIKFCLVASGGNDPIYRTKYRDKVILKRESLEVNKSLFNEIHAAAKRNLIYCPTTEFINHYLIENPDSLADTSITANLPSKGIYQSITEKYTSQSFAADIKNLTSIDSFSVSSSPVPCVLKPYKNVVDNKSLYPIFCMDKDEFQSTVKKIDTSLYFSQRYIHGKSYYLCGYISAKGNFKYFWQENLVQQQGGKSILLARETKSPGAIENDFFKSLFKRSYYGPVMLEIMLFNNTLYYIEVNPRFWGPLQLTLDSCPEILDLFVLDNGVPPNQIINRKSSYPNYYAWHGGLGEKVRNYSDMNIEKLHTLIEKFDVFNHDYYSDMS